MTSRCLGLLLLTTRLLLTNSSHSFQSDDSAIGQRLRRLQGRFFLDPISQLLPGLYTNSRAILKEPPRAHVSILDSSPPEEAMEEHALDAVPYFSEYDSDVGQDSSDDFTNSSAGGVSGNFDPTEESLSLDGIPQKLRENLDDSYYRSTSPHRANEFEEIAGGFQDSAEDTVDAIEKPPAHFSSSLVEPRHDFAPLEEVQGYASDQLKNAPNLSQNVPLPNSKGHTGERMHHRRKFNDYEDKTKSNMRSPREGVPVSSGSSQTADNKRQTIPSDEIPRIPSSKKAPEAAATPHPFAEQHNFPNNGEDEAAAPADLWTTSPTPVAGTLHSTNGGTSDSIVRPVYAVPRARASDGALTSPSSAAALDRPYPYVSSPSSGLEFWSLQEVAPVTFQSPAYHSQNVKASTKRSSSSSSIASDSASPHSWKPPSLLPGSMAEQESPSRFSRTPAQTNHQQFPSASGAPLKMAPVSTLPEYSSSRFFAFPSPPSSPAHSPTYSKTPQPHWHEGAGILANTSSSAPLATLSFTPSPRTAADRQSLSSSPPVDTLLFKEKSSGEREPSTQQKPHPSSPDRKRRRSTSHVYSPATKADESSVQHLVPHEDNPNTSSTSAIGSRAFRPSFKSVSSPLVPSVAPSSPRPSPLPPAASSDSTASFSSDDIVSTALPHSPFPSNVSGSRASSSGSNSHSQSAPSSPVSSLPPVSSYPAAESLVKTSPHVVQNTLEAPQFVVSRRLPLTDTSESSFFSSSATFLPWSSNNSPVHSPTAYNPEQRPRTSSSSPGGTSRIKNARTETVPAFSATLLSPSMGPVPVLNHDDIGAHITNVILNELHTEGEEAADSQESEEVSIRDITFQTQHREEQAFPAGVTEDGPVSRAAPAAAAAGRDLEELARGAADQVFQHSGAPPSNHVDTCLQLDAEFVGGELLDAFSDVPDLATCIVLCSGSSESSCTHFSYYSTRKICLLRSEGAALQFLSKTKLERARGRDSTSPVRPLPNTTVGDLSDTHNAVAHGTAAVNESKSEITNESRQSPIFSDVSPLESRPAPEVVSGRLHDTGETCSWKHSIRVGNNGDNRTRRLQQSLRHAENPPFSGFDSVDEERGDPQFPFQTLSEVTDVAEGAVAFEAGKQGGGNAEGEDEANLVEKIRSDDAEETEEGEETEGDAEGAEEEIEEEWRIRKDEERLETHATGDIRFVDTGGGNYPTDAGLTESPPSDTMIHTVHWPVDRRMGTNAIPTHPPFHVSAHAATETAGRLEGANPEVTGRPPLQYQEATPRGGAFAREEDGHLARKQWQMAAAAAMAAAAERALLDFELQQQPQHTTEPALPHGVANESSQPSHQQDAARTVAAAAAAVAVAVEQGLLALETEKQRLLLSQQKEGARVRKQQGKYRGVRTMRKASNVETQEREPDKFSCLLNLMPGEIPSPYCSRILKEISAEQSNASSLSPSATTRTLPSPVVTSKSPATLTQVPASLATSLPSARVSSAAPASQRDRASRTLSSVPDTHSPSSMLSSPAPSSPPSYFPHISPGSSSPFLSPVTPPPRSLLNNSSSSFSATAQPRRLGVGVEVEHESPLLSQNIENVKTHESVVAAAAAAIADALHSAAAEKEPFDKFSKRAHRSTTQEGKQNVVATLPQSEKPRRLKRKHQTAADSTWNRSSSAPAGKKHTRKGTLVSHNRRTSKSVTGSDTHNVLRRNGKTTNDNITVPCMKGANGQCAQGDSAGDTNYKKRSERVSKAFPSTEERVSDASAKPENLWSPHTFPLSWFPPVSTAPTPACPPEWQLTQHLVGWDLFDNKNFWFFSFDDPTHGYVNYLTRDAAVKNGLISVTSDGRSVIKADAWNKVPPGVRGRDSVRLTSTKGYDDVIWVVSVNHVPEGCATWPALWTLGPPPWPDSGEIDIYEGVNKEKYNHVSLHTSKGCSMWDVPETQFSGVWAHAGEGREARDCWAYSTPTNCGCAIEALEESFGQPLNARGGGVFVMELKRDSHVRVWFFGHHEVPRDLTEGHPVPDLWSSQVKLPQAVFPLGENCPGKEKFSLQRLVINLTFCGDWAGNTFSTKEGCPGVGLEACQRYVQDNPEAFRNAFWDINYVQAYTLKEGTCGRRMQARGEGAVALPPATEQISSDDLASPVSPRSATIGRNPGFVYRPHDMLPAHPPDVMHAVPHQPLYQQHHPHQQPRDQQRPSEQSEFTPLLPYLQPLYEQQQQLSHTYHHQNSQQPQHQTQQHQRYKKQLPQHRWPQHRQQHHVPHSSGGGSKISLPHPALLPRRQIIYSRAPASRYSWPPVHQRQPTQRRSDTARQPAYQQHQMYFPVFSNTLPRHHRPVSRPFPFPQQQWQRTSRPGLPSAIRNPRSTPETQQQRDWWATLLDAVAHLSGEAFGRCNEQDVVYYGFDLKTYKGYVPFAWQCRELCVKDAACFFFTHFPDEATCHLKSVEALKGRITNQPSTDINRYTRICLEAAHELARPLVESLAYRSPSLSLFSRDTHTCGQCRK